MAGTETNSGSFVVINQVNPQGNQAQPEGLNPNAPAQLPKPLVKFYQGEPEALGSAQICIGIILFTFGIPLSAFPEIHYYFPDVMVFTGMLFWTGLMCILSGSLTVAASIKPTLGKVMASLVLNIISSVLAVVGIIIVAFTIPFYSHHKRQRSYCAYYKPYQGCEGQYVKEDFLCGISATILILIVLAFTTNVSISAFGCKTVCRKSYTETTVVIYQTTSSYVPIANPAQPTDILKT